MGAFVLNTFNDERANTWKIALNSIYLSPDCLFFCLRSIPARFINYLPMDQRCWRSNTFSCSEVERAAGLSGLLAGGVTSESHPISRSSPCIDEKKNGTNSPPNPLFITINHCRNCLYRGSRPAPKSSSVTSRSIRTILERMARDGQGYRGQDQNPANDSSSSHTVKKICCQIFSSPSSYTFHVSGSSCRASSIARGVPSKNQPWPISPSKSQWSYPYVGTIKMLITKT